MSMFALCVGAMEVHAQSYNFDVNGDGHVNSTDVTVLYNYLLSDDAKQWYTRGYNYDVNGDNYVNSTDVTVLYNYLLSDDVNPDNHEWVDLGLPSGTLWATMNVGASKPEDYGDYFAWGETMPKSVNNWSTYKWCMGSYDTLTKYCTDSDFGYNGFVDDITELAPEDDAATANWGSDWCIPSLEQIQELRNNCTNEWTTRNGVNGRLFTSDINGESLFLPAAGECSFGEHYFAGSWGQYWSRTLYSSYPHYAYFLDFNSSNVYWYHKYSYRYSGQSVRAVRVSQN